jgi:hypothetical protein
MPPYAPIPDCYGYSLFCDDIRYEVGNKISYIGSYRGSMNFKGSYPLILPKFIISIHFFQKREVFVPPIVWIFLPGDPDDKPAVIQEFPLESPLETFPPEGGEYIYLLNHITFVPLAIQEDGAIKVRIFRNGELHRIGALSVQIEPPISDAT